MWKMQQGDQEVTAYYNEMTDIQQELEKKNGKIQQIALGTKRRRKEAVYLCSWQVYIKSLMKFEAAFGLEAITIYARCLF